VQGIRSLFLHVPINLGEKKPVIFSDDAAIT
jgi:hypothetical protein